MYRLLKPVEHNDIMPSPNFEHSVFEAEEEEWDEIPEEVARQLENEEDTIQPYKEPLETVNLGSEENVKEVKNWSIVIPTGQGAIDQPVERVCRCVCLVLSRYAWAEY